MVKTALIFPVFNKLDYTKKGLADIYSCFDAKGTDTIPVDIVITDDGSTDGSYAWITANYPHITVLKGNGSLWWSGGINKAIRHVLDNSDSDYVLLWNNDIRPEKAYFPELFQVLKKNKPETIVCSKIYIEHQQETVLSLGGIFNPKTGRYALNGYGEKDNEELNKPVKVDWFPGMGTSIHRDVFKKVGFFDEKNFPQYHGDSDFGLRAKKAGYTIMAFPQLKIWNDRTNTGYSNDTSFATFIKSMTTLKSNFNIFREFKFYNRHATGMLAYGFMIRKYFRHIAGYIKWSFLGLFGIRRKTKNALTE